MKTEITVKATGERYEEEQRIKKSKNKINNATYNKEHDNYEV
jgi:hypothetical protein